MEYFNQLREKQNEIHAKRIQENNKQMEVAQWLTKSVQKTQMHKIVEKEAESTKELVEKAKNMREMQKAQMQAYGKVVRENFKPKVSEILRGKLL